jgi:hypothetical protein
MSEFMVREYLYDTNKKTEKFAGDIIKQGTDDYIPFTKRAKIENPLDIRKLTFIYQNACTDLRGIEELENLEEFYIIGCAADMTSLSKCKKLKSITIYDLECFLTHPSIKYIDFKDGYLTNYSKIEFDNMIEKFKERDIMVNVQLRID